jgi:hypothetical protein
MKSRFWICVLLAVTLAACAHGPSKPASTFNVAVPEGWRSINSEEPMLFLTKDGGYKQFVLIRERPLDEPFTFSKRAMRDGMKPEEAAEVIVGEIAADTNITNFSLLENVPARIAGHSGFRLTFIYTDADGFVFKTIYYGFIKGGTFYNIRYAATQDDYFNRDLKTFQQVFESFKLVSAKAS